jgi:hypothetical protein
VPITDKLKSYAPAKREIMLGVEQANTGASIIEPRIPTNRRDDGTDQEAVQVASAGTTVSVYP